MVDVVWGGPGNDTVWGEWTDGVGDVVCGGPGHDYLLGGTGDDKVDGGLGKDSVNGGNGGNDLVLGGPGRDSVMDTDDCEFDDPVGTDVLRGGPGPDYLCSYDGRDELYGDAGDDDLRDHAAGRTLLHGGAGDDTVWSWRYRAWRRAVRPDVVSGGPGTDSALVSRLDRVVSTELVTVYVHPDE